MYLIGLVLNKTTNCPTASVATDMQLILMAAALIIIDNNTLAITGHDMIY